ncbi:hypothetical protein LTR95_004078, partial [Oleoguttula sp. CCFEE 5521]
RVEEEMQEREDNRTNRKLGLPETMPRGLEHAGIASAQLSVPSTTPALAGPAPAGVAPMPATQIPRRVEAPVMPATQVPHRMDGNPLQQQGFPGSHDWMNLPQQQTNPTHPFASGGRDVRNGTFQDGSAPMSISPPARPLVATGRSSPDHGVHGLPTPRRGGQ